jgi:hypothetical protein
VGAAGAEGKARRSVILLKLVTEIFFSARRLRRLVPCATLRAVLHCREFAGSG